VLHVSEERQEIPETPDAAYIEWVSAAAAAVTHGGERGGLQGREVVASFQQTAAVRAFVEDGVNREAIRTAGVEADEFSGHPEFPAGGSPHRTSERVFRYGRADSLLREPAWSRSDVEETPRRLVGG